MEICAGLTGTRGTDAITASQLHSEKGCEHRAMLGGALGGNSVLHESQQASLVLVSWGLATPPIGNATYHPH